MLFKLTIAALCFSATDALKMPAAGVSRRAALERVAQAAALASIPSAAMALPCQPNCGVNGQEMFVVRNRGVGEESGSQSSDTGFATADKRGATPALSGKYEDPQHPGMARKVSKSGKFVFISGADEDGSKFKLSGSIEGRVLTVDFSPKGGPTDLQAVAGFSPKDGSIILKFPDGNVWTRL